jgi:exopolyphosphatase/guanosine-5'-triphosphate,3'-diphosphate pyrophosphatase
MGDNLAAIDVGTNSLHLVVARVTGHDRFEVIESEKEMVRLGRGGGDMKVLSDEAMNRAVTALTRFRQIAEIHEARVRAVATSATREALNHEVFLQRAREVAGVEIEVISGVEEARLIHLGVLQAVPVFDQRLLLCDIGGGSTELVLGHRGAVLASRSLKLGAVRLTDRFFPGQRTRAAAVADCRSFIRWLVTGFHREIETHGFEVTVGSSGTIEAMALMVSASRGEPPPRTVNGFAFSRREVAAVVDELIAARTVRQRARTPGLDPRRADIILAGALILEGVLDLAGAKEMTFSGFALREGVLLDTLQRTRGGSVHHLRDLSRRSVQAFVEVWDEEPAHSAHVASLALQLFDATAAVHGLDEGCREYLEAAALLANVGLFISHSQHHLHSYYVIRNSERLAGFTDAEIEIIAQVARYHRKSAPKDSHVEFARLRADEQEIVRTLAGILRVAIGLDRRHDRRVGAVRTRQRGGLLTIEALPGADADLSLELYAANDRKALLEEVLGLRVQVVEPSPERMFDPTA